MNRTPRRRSKLLSVLPLASLSPPSAMSSPGRSCCCHRLLRAGSPQRPQPWLSTRCVSPSPPLDQLCRVAQASRGSPHGPDCPQNISRLCPLGRGSPVTAATSLQNRYQTTSL